MAKSPEAYAIETGIPLPPRPAGPGTQAGALPQALRQLSMAQVGASIFVPDKKPAGLGPYIKYAAGIGWAASRTVDGGARIWKIAEPKRKAARGRSKSGLALVAGAGPA